MNQILKDITLLTECAKVFGTLAETRHAPDSSIRLGQDLLDMAKRLRDSVDGFKKVMPSGYGGYHEYTKAEYIDGAVNREAKEMMQDATMYSEVYKQKLRDDAAKRWDEAK